MFEIHIDLPSYDQLERDLGKDLDKKVSEIVQSVATSALHHILDLADQKLHSLKDRYMGSLSMEMVDPTTMLISLDDTAAWIEEGIDPGFQMLPGLLASPKAKTSKDGSKYLIVPMDRVGDNTTTPKATEAKEALAKDLFQNGLSIEGIETDLDGNPKTGTLHTFQFTEGPTGKTGIPINKGVKIKQFYKNGQIKRSVTTFRTASSKQNASEYWVNSGVEALNAFPATYEWLLEELDGLVEHAMS